MLRAVAVIRPTRIVLVEAEVWPNLVALAHERRIPTILVNARLSPRSERRFRRFRFFVAPTFRLLDLVCSQEPDDVDRWVAIGVARDRIRAVGSIKYDPNGRDQRPEAQETARTTGVSDANRQRPVLFGGSTHRGEEESLTGPGGEKPVEPIMACYPVVFGPYMENFATLAKALVLKKGAIQVRDADSLEMTIAGLLRDGDARERLLENARDVLNKHHGATARAAALIHQFHSRL